MGKGKRKNENGDRRNQPKRARPDTYQERADLPGNAAYEVYYALQGIVSPQEWKIFMAKMQEPLPLAFRIHMDCPYRDKLIADMSSHVGEVLVVDGAQVEPFKPIPWFPGELAYKLACDRKMLRKTEALKDLHQWLQSQTETGSITRQEEVSMIPPLLMDVEPGMVIMDMCAAPGSKTEQLLQLVSADGNSNGLVIANDANLDRAYMLSHQCKRVSAAALCVTHCAAQLYPTFKRATPVPPEKGGDRGLFDRVLCDVPCSGDGTLRKQNSIWKGWKMRGALAIHSLQVLISCRGISLCKVGGLIVYSTCSINPIENEAVVAELLRRAGGNLELKDCKDVCPSLVRRPGLSSWVVLEEKKVEKTVSDGGKSTEDKSTEANDGEEEQGADNDQPMNTPLAPGELDPGSHTRESLLEIAAKMDIIHYPSYSSVPADNSTLVTPSCFPPTAEEAAAMHLDRCLRLLPQDQDTGGFFVAVLKKVGPITVATMMKEKIRRIIDMPEKQGDAPVDENTSAAPASDDHKAEMLAEALPEEKMEVEQPQEEESKGGDLSDDELVLAEAVAAEAPPAAEEAQQSKRKTKKGGDNKNNKGAAKGGRGKYSGDTCEFTPYDGEGWEDVKDFFGLSENFPRHLLYQRGSGTKIVSIVTQATHDIVFAKQRNGKQSLTIVSAGVRAFERSSLSKKNSSCSHRLCYEGLEIMLPYLSKNVFKASRGDFSRVVNGGIVRLPLLSPGLELSLRTAKMGCVVLVLERAPHRQLAVPVWYDKAITVLVRKEFLTSIKSEMQATGEYYDYSAEVTTKAEPDKKVEVVEEQIA